MVADDRVDLTVIAGDAVRSRPEPIGCLDGVDIPRDQLNTVIHEVMHMVLEIHVTEEAKVAAILLGNVRVIRRFLES